MITAEKYFGSLNVAKARQQLVNRPNILKRTISNKKLRAELNHGRWIINCPYCNNAEFAWDDNLFFCSLCGNKQLNGQLYTVVMPPRRETMEKVLEFRHITNQSWKYPETLNMLKAENIACGLEVN